MKTGNKTEHFTTPGYWPLALGPETNKQFFKAKLIAAHTAGLLFFFIYDKNGNKG